MAVRRGDIEVENAYAEKNSFFSLVRKFLSFYDRLY